jgi:lysophospholipase L1-like esterase
MRTGVIRHLLLASSAMLGGTVGALALVELGLRAFSLAPSVGISTVTETEFTRVPGLFGPGQEIVDRRLPALPFAVRINALGYRGADFALEKAAGELRVLAIGDSFTYGDFVDDDETLPAVLERRLSAGCAGPVTVINAGVGGSTITTHIRMLERAWIASPEVVVLTFSENDVSDLANEMWRDLAENRRAKSRFPLSLAYPVLRRLALWHFSLEVRARLRARTEVIEVVEVDRPKTEGRTTHTDALRAEYALRFAELESAVRARGGSLLLVAFPSHHTVSGTRSDEQLHWIIRLAHARGVPAVNMQSAFATSGLPTDSLYLLPHDGHASPRGNALAGALVAARLVETGVCAHPGGRHAGMQHTASASAKTGGVR